MSSEGNSEGEEGDAVRTTELALRRLKSLQDAHNDLEAKYYSELRVLQKKYQLIFAYNYHQRFETLADPGGFEVSYYRISIITI